MLGPGHVSQGEPRRGAGEGVRGGQIAGKPGCDAPTPQVISTPRAPRPTPSHPTHKGPGPSAPLSDPQAPRLSRARCHVTPPPPLLKHRRNAGRRKAFAPARLGPAPPGAGESREPRRAGGTEGGLGAGPERATKASAPVAVVPGRAGARFSGPAAKGQGKDERARVPAASTATSRDRSDGPRPPRPAQAPCGLPPPARAEPAPGPPAPRSRSTALARPPSWIGASNPRAAAAAAFPLFPAPRRRRRRPHSPQLPIRALPAVDLVFPQKSPVCYSRCGGVVTGWSPGVRERGPRLQRSCNPNPPSGGIFHTPMAPLQTWVRTALCWPWCLLPC